MTNDFLISTTPDQHDIETDNGLLRVWVTPLSWIQQQEAVSKFVDFNMDGDDIQPNLDFGGYWRYILDQCVVKTEPPLSKNDLLNLKPEVGNKLSEALPGLTDLLLGFSGGQADPLE